MLYNEALEYIYSFMKKDSLHKKSTDHLKNTKSILQLMGYEQNFKIIHITGTKGKGSTTLSLAKMLETSEYKAGAFISPHIIDERERISINGNWISKDDFSSITEKIKIIIEQKLLEETITVFEFFTIIGLYYFYEKKVDYACIEVGIGGRLDSTNIVSPVLSIITSISYDHMNILGDTLSKIAYQKAGIIKQNIPTVSAYQEDEALKTLNIVAKEKNSKLYLVKKDFDYEIIYDTKEKLTFKYIEENYSVIFETSLLGYHQAENISLAYKAFRLLNKDKNENFYERARESLKNFQIKARLTFVQKNPDIIVDGAHNAKSMERILKTVYKWYDFIIILFAPLSEKDIKGMCEELKKYKNKMTLILTAPHMQYKETDSFKVYEYLKDFNARHIPDFIEAVAYMKEESNKTNSPALVTGSLYTASDYISMNL